MGYGITFETKKKDESISTFILLISETTLIKNENVVTED